jgi:predicted phosphodiesterase
MATKVSPAGKYVQKLLAEFPDAPALTLAKKAYAAHPEYWKDLETCRGMVRTYLGVRGKRARKRVADKKFFRQPRPAGWTGVIPEALVQLPGWGTVEIPGPLKALVISDVHFPFHDEEALALALDYGFKRKPTVVLLNGDLCDHYALSRFETDPALRDFPGEVLMVKQFLRELRKCAGKRTRLILKEGNHEERFGKFLRLKAPELLGLPDFEWQSVFGLKDQGVEFVKDKRPIRLGAHLNVIHGHEYNYPITNPVNPARGLFLRAKTNALCGHHHQTSQHSEKNLDGKVVSTFSTGCLCDLVAAFRPINAWNSGFAWVEIDKEGGFHVENLKIIKGKVF